MNQNVAATVVPPCIYCGHRDAAMERVDALRRRCSDERACGERVRTKRPQLAAVQSRTVGQTPAEAMIDLLQTRARIGDLTGPVELGDELSLPIDALQGRFVAFGKSGSGKSNASAVMVENCFINDVPVCAFDTLGNLWGLRRGDDGEGLDIPIIGGVHGDLPLAAEDGALLADIFAKGHSMVIDSSALEREDQQALASAFFRQSLRVLRRPAHVVVEEAESIAPAFTRSKTHFASQGATTLFARQIRNFGVGWTFSTQRLPLLHPDIIDASNAFIAMQTTGDEAQRKIGREAKTRVGTAIAGVILNELGQLPVGGAWLIPDSTLLDTEVGAPIRLRFRKRWTFDSTAVPNIGRALAEPPPPISVDLTPFRALRK
jgi:hypothetical protein